MGKIIQLYYQAYAIDLKLIYNIWYWRNYYGYSIPDLAFLTDINLKLLQSIEDPTLRVTAATPQDDERLMMPRISVGEYDLDQLDFFRAIFDTVPLEELVPKLFLIDDKIMVFAESNAITGKRLLKISKVIEDTEPILLYDFDKSQLKTAPLKFKDNKARIIKLIGQLIDGGYFDTEKLAIEIYKHFIAVYGFTPRPIVLEKALSFYTAKKKGVRLAKRKPKNGHTVFVKVS